MSDEMYSMPAPDDRQLAEANQEQDWQQMLRDDAEYEAWDVLNAMKENVYQGDEDERR